MLKKNTHIELREEILINPTNELLPTHIFAISGEQSSNKIMNP